MGCSLLGAFLAPASLHLDCRRWHDDQPRSAPSVFQSSARRRRTKAIARCCTLQTDSSTRPSLAVCHGPSCSQNGGGSNLFYAVQLLTAACDSSKLIDVPSVEMCGCLGSCSTTKCNVGIVGSDGAPRIKTMVGSVEGAVALIEHISQVRISSEAVEALAAKEDGNKLLSHGYVHEAIEMYGKSILALEKLPQTEAVDAIVTAILANRSSAFLSDGNFASALKDANKAVDIRPDLSAAWRRKGEAEECLERPADAAVSLEMAGKLEPNEKKRAVLEAKVKKLRNPGWKWSLF